MQVKSRVSCLSKSIVLAVFVLTLCRPLVAKSIVFFSPDDKPTKHLLTLLNGAEKRIYAAIYMLTDKTIAMALIDAKEKRGVDVQVVCDQISQESQFGKVDLLTQHGIKTFVFQPKIKETKYSHSIMHNKFAIIDDAVWTGSFNWTVAANRHNQENVIISDERDIHKQYLSRFEHLKKESVAQKIKNPAKQKTTSSGLGLLGALANLLRVQPHRP